MIYSDKFDLIQSIAKVEELALKRSVGHTRQKPERKVPRVNQHLRSWSRTHAASSNCIYLTTPGWSVKGNEIMR